ncbi:MAG: hypothetical protein PHR51_01905 [Patescibacteria group bacterium]|nr:hypothetical protein [Patescibacteria group bacterium]
MEEERVQQEVVSNRRPSSEDKVFAALSYVSILFLVPLILRRDSRFVYFHARQGMALFVLEIFAWIVLSVLGSLLTAITPYGAWAFISFLNTLIGWAFVVISVIGIYYAWTGSEWEMPVLGKYAKKLRV